MRTREPVCERDIRGLISAFKSFNSIELKELYIRCLENFVGNPALIEEGMSLLKEEGYMKSSGKTAELLKKFDEKAEEILENHIRDAPRYEGMITTPLEISKFYQCKRRFWLEKVVLAREWKSSRGKVWDGEAVHEAAEMLSREALYKSREDLKNNISDSVYGKWRGRITIDRERIAAFVEKLYDLIMSENLVRIFPERLIYSPKRKIIGSPDMVAFGSSDIIPIDIKMGRIYEKPKPENLIQVFGEALLAEDYFSGASGGKIKRGYLYYVQSDVLVKAEFTESIRKKTTVLMEEMKDTCRKGEIPEKLSEADSGRACRGCHVISSCRNIENLERC